MPASFAAAQNENERYFYDGVNQRQTERHYAPWLKARQERWNLRCGGSWISRNDLIFNRRTSISHCFNNGRTDARAAR